MDVCGGCCVLSGRGLCDELITRPEESYRLWCVVVCDLEIEKKYTRLYGDRGRTRPDLDTSVSTVFHPGRQTRDTVRVTNNLSAYSRGNSSHEWRTLNRILAGP